MDLSAVKSLEIVRTQTLEESRNRGLVLRMESEKSELFRDAPRWWWKTYEEFITHFALKEETVPFWRGFVSMKWIPRPGEEYSAWNAWDKVTQEQASVPASSSSSCAGKNSSSQRYYTIHDRLYAWKGFSKVETLQVCCLNFNKHSQLYTAETSIDRCKNTIQSL